MYRNLPPDSARTVNVDASLATGSVSDEVWLGVVEF